MFDGKPLFSISHEKTYICTFVENIFLRYEALISKIKIVCNDSIMVNSKSDLNKSISDFTKLS